MEHTESGQTHGRWTGNGDGRPHVHCLTFDVEEHFHVSAFDSPMRRRHWEQFESRIERNMHRLLPLLNDHGIRVTFFILGWVAERHPQLIREIAQAGHEIASHGYGHEMIVAQSRRAFREDVKRARAILQDIIGAVVCGYRAPSFSISPDTAWALPILAEEGYTYDSSIFPILHDRYGWRGADPGCHRMETSAGPLWEVPPTTVAVGGVRIPVAGGGYLRVFPFWLMRSLLTRAAVAGSPLVLYLHPWELDPHQPRMNGSFLSRVRHYVNLHKTEGRLVRLLNEYSFAPIRDVVPESWGGNQPNLSLPSAV